MITLQEIMSPKSIAIVGASDNKARIGGRPLAHMIEQKFSGGIFPINPNRDTVQGIKAYPSLLDVKDDLTLISILFNFASWTEVGCITFEPRDAISNISS